MKKSNSQDQKFKNIIVFDYIPEKVTTRSKYSFWITIIILVTSWITLSVLNLFLPQDSIWGIIITDLNTAVVISIIIGLLFIKIPEYFSLSRNIRLVEFLLETKKFKEAEEIIIECLKININKPGLYNLYGRLLIENNKLELAEKVLLRGLQKNKKYYQLDYNLASLYIRKANLSKAEKYNNLALKKLKKDPKVLFQRILILLKNCLYEEMNIFYEENSDVFKKDDIILEETICYLLYGAANLKKYDLYNNLLKMLNLGDFKRDTNSYQILISSYIMKDIQTIQKMVDFIEKYKVRDSLNQEQIDVIITIEKDMIQK